MNLSCIIIDDEPNAVNLLEILIHQTTEWQLMAKCYDALEAMAFLKKNKVDFIFLDINMPQLTGMELAGLLPNETKIVFTTAYSEYAAESYSFQTIDYLLKPITLRRFYAALQKIEDFFSRPAQSATLPEPAGIGALPQTGTGSEADYFFIKSGRMLHKVLLKDILYFEGEKEYDRLVTPAQRILIHRRLKDIEEQISASFARVHNSYIVNIARLDSIRDNHVFIGSKQIPISEKFRETFMNRIKQRVF